MAPGPDGASHCTLDEGHEGAHDFTPDTQILVEVPGFVSIGPFDPHCSWCGARPPAEASIVVMVAGPDGATLCVDCGGRLEAQRARAARQ